MRLEDLEKLEHNGAYSSEMAGARTAAQPETDARFIHPAGKVGLVHLIWGRSEQEIDTVVPAEALVFEEGSGVPAEVFFGAELGRIDKNGCDDGAFNSGDGSGVIKKGGVPPV